MAAARRPAAAMNGANGATASQAEIATSFRAADKPPARVEIAPMVSPICGPCWMRIISGLMPMAPVTATSANWRDRFSVSAAVILVAPATLP